MSKHFSKEEIAKILKEARLSTGLTQKKAAEAIGRKQQTLASWETGQSQPDANTLFLLLSVYGADINETFGFTTSKVVLDRHEKTIIELYRSQPHLQESVDRVLGASKDKSKVVKIDSYNKRKEMPLTPDQIRAVSVQKIPLLGKVSAGQPILAEEDFECYFEVDTDIKGDFCLHVNGDSMVNARINDGDIVFIRQQPDVNDGEIGVVLIDDEATLKRVYKNNGSITLVAENTKYKPIVISGKETIDVRILGKAVAFQSDVK